MFQFFTESGQVRDGHAYITGSDVNHIRNVLRLKAGDRLQVIQEDDPHLYLCRILQTEGDTVQCAVEEVLPQETELPVKVILIQALPKGDKMEWILQKCVELGVQEVVPVATKNAVVKLDPKKAANKVGRWNEIAKAAAKQAKRGMIPLVHPVASFAEAISMMQNMDQALIAYEHADMNRMDETRKILTSIREGQTVGIFIGPEGGFTPEEVELAMQSGIRPVTLGRRILRTETAGMTILSWLVYVLEK